MSNVFVFPGQGSQSREVLQQLATYGENIYKNQFNIISDAVGFDVIDFVSDATPQELSNVRYTQIVVFAMNIAYYEIAKNFGFRADVVAGHSIGQYCAFYASGIFSSLWDVSALINKRALLMSKVNTNGKLCAIKAPYCLDVEAIKTVCQKMSNIPDIYVDIALFNSDKQVVIGGNELGINELVSYIKDIDDNYSTTILNVGQAFHTKLFKFPQNAISNHQKHALQLGLKPV